MILEDYILLHPKNSLKKDYTHNTLMNSNSLQFHRSLKSYSVSKLHSLASLAKNLGVKNIFVKDESTRFGLKAFKGLGTSYAVVHSLKENQDIQTFCTATDGNHGKALAWSAGLAKKNAVIVIPKHTTEARIKAIEAKKAQVIRFDGNYDEACLYAEELSKQDGWKLIQDVAWDGYEEIPAQIMSGYLSIFKEMENDLHSLDEPKMDIVFLQAGVGSFASSAVWYYLNRYGIKKPKIVIVEPCEADGILESFKRKELTTSKGKQETIMAGLNCGLPSSIAWPILKAGVDAVIRIKDKYAKDAMKLLYQAQFDDPKIFSGESGAAGLAGYLSLQNEKDIVEHLGLNSNSRLLFFNTEGDTDPAHFQEIISSS
jgi:diaminopropionate ammonia-lyase